MLPGTAAVGVAVSGGVDSVVLLHALRELHPRRPLCAVHLNHGLRGRESDGDEAFVGALAERLNCRFLVRRTGPAALRAQGSRNLEEAGRRFRYRFFGELVADGACDAVPS